MNILLQGPLFFERITLFTAPLLNFLSDMVSTVREILRRGMSVNLYMFHGGSSFGFMSGALADPSYKALVPSYGWFLCVMWCVTKKKAVRLMQILKDFITMMSHCHIRAEAYCVFPHVYRTAFPLTPSRWQCVIVKLWSVLSIMSCRLWCSLVWSGRVHSEVPSPQRSTFPLQQ